MDLNTFVEKFCEQLENTDISTVNASTDYKALAEWDSLVALSVIAMIDEEFEVVITGSDIDGNTTIEDLYNTVQSRL
jgi:hypothetical protein|nr:acyl carrier protein [Odoribacter splanchnicus]